MADLYQQAQEYRRNLLAGEREAATRILEAYGGAFGRVRNELVEVARAIRVMRDMGLKITPDLVLREQRFAQTLVLLEMEMRRFGQFAADTVTSQQLRAVDAAVNDALGLIQAQLTPPPSAPPVAAQVTATFTRPNFTAVEHLVGTMADGSPLTQVFASFAPTMVPEVKQKFVDAMVMGKNPREVARELKRDMGLGLKRALTISRTEVLRSYRQASLTTYQENDDVVGQWMWIAKLDRRTCGACVAMHGTRHPLSTEFFGTHPNCRCAPMPVTKSWEELGFDGIEDTRPTVQTGVDWFAEQDAATQDAILGPKKADAYRDGKLPLEDVVGYRYSKEWGPGRYEKSAVALGL